MKKLLFVFAVALAVGFASCSSSDDDDENGKGKGNGNGNGDGDGTELPCNWTDIDKYAYSELSSEDQKKKLESDGIKFIQAMQGLDNTPAALLIKNLGDLGLPNMQAKSNKSASASGLTFAIIKSITTIKQYNRSYTWNSKKGVWDEAASADKLVLNFPATKGATTNNGRVEVTAISSGVNIDGQEMPKETTAKFFVDNKEVGKTIVTLDGVNETDFAKASTVETVLGEYVVNISLVNDSQKKNISSIKLTKGSEVLLTGCVNLEAKLGEVLIDENVTSLGNGQLEVRIMDNLMIKGGVNAGKISEEMKAIDSKYSSQDGGEKEAIEIAECLNKNTSLVLASKSDKVKLADIKFRSYITAQTQWYTDYEQTPVLEFKDGTKVDFDVYFSKGFNKLIAEWESFIAKFN